MLSSGAGRWVIAAALAAYAFCDGLAQYLAAATPLPAALAMPHSVTRFLQVLHCLPMLVHIDDCRPSDASKATLCSFRC